MFKKPLTALAASACVLAAGQAQAAVSADEAKQLGSTLTPFGAEKAASADGSIPAYDGPVKAPASYKGGNVRPDPFAADKPRFSIKGSPGQYADKLTEATKELLKRYPNFRVEVYPTRRSVGYPKYLLDNTAKNATQCKTIKEGLGIEGCRAGISFPIPKNGQEVMWNHLTRFTGLSFTLKFDSYNVDRTGKQSLSTTGIITQEYPQFASKNADRVIVGSDVFFQTKVEYTDPPRRSGEALLIKDYIDPMQNRRRGWQYLPGQRRVKEAPEIAYDTPNPGTAGNSTYDDAFIFNGAMDRYDWKLIGKKEMIVPYNTYAWSNDMGDRNLMGPNFINPDVLRWEVRRVWVVEANLKPGKRHIYAKRVFYVEEDSWTAVASDMYDARGQLYRGGFFSISPAYDQGGVPNSVGQAFYDFTNNSYSISGINAGKYGGIKFHNPLSANDWSPDSLSTSGVR